MVATRSSAPANVNEFKDVNMDSNSDAGTNSSTNANAEVDIGVVANASTLTKEPADTNETTMGGLHAGIDISMDKDDYLVRSMGRFEKLGINPHELSWKSTFLPTDKVKETKPYGIPNTPQLPSS